MSTLHGAAYMRALEAGIRMLAMGLPDESAIRRFVALPHEPGCLRAAQAWFREANQRALWIAAHPWSCPDCRGGGVQDCWEGECSTCACAAAGFCPRCGQAGLFYRSIYGWEEQAHWYIADGDNATCTLCGWRADQPDFAPPWPNWSPCTCEGTPVDYGFAEQMLKEMNAL